jgi:hypothetical protein
MLGATDDVVRQPVGATVRTHCDDDRIGIELDERVFDRWSRSASPATG